MTKEPFSYSPSLHRALRLAVVPQNDCSVIMVVVKKFLVFIRGLIQMPYI